MIALPEPRGALTELLLAALLHVGGERRALATADDLVQLGLHVRRAECPPLLREGGFEGGLQLADAYAPQAE